MANVVLRYAVSLKRMAWVCPSLREEKRTVLLVRFFVEGVVGVQNTGDIVRVTGVVIRCSGGNAIGIQTISLKLRCPALPDSRHEFGEPCVGELLGADILLVSAPDCHLRLT